MPLEIEETLANLNPSSVEGAFPSSRGSIPNIPESDIALGLGLARRHCKTEAAFLLLRAMFAEQPMWEDVIKTYMWSAVSRIGKRNGWPGYGTISKKYRDTYPIYESLINLAYSEHLHHKKCPTCYGRASVLIDNKLIVCETCMGADEYHPTDEMRARYIGMTDEQFADWIKTHRRIRMILLAWQVNATNAYRKAFLHDCSSPNCIVCNRKNLQSS